MQATESKRSGYGDTSQHKNWENFRNATFDETPFVLTSTAPRPRCATCRWCFTEFTTHCTGEFEMPDPPKGVLEFDYVSTARPRRYTRKMRRQYVCVAFVCFLFPGLAPNFAGCHDVFPEHLCVWGDTSARS